MTLPSAVRDGVEAALSGRAGRTVEISDVAPVGGGCISPTGRLTTGEGDTYFLKWGDESLPDGLLAAEARGLAGLAEPGFVRVPEVLALGDGASPAWLLMEWLEPGSGTADAWRGLGRDLAALHRSRGERWGEKRPNFIGSLPQANEPTDTWAAFWQSRRLEPQLTRALEGGMLDGSDRRLFDAFYGRLPELLAPAEDDGPSRLHGDLWNGNVHMLAGGGAALIDPSFYYGHREVDLAMAELFGGFGADFRRAYDEAWPLAPGYAPRRRAAYQLYYLLVHVNLFGRSYVSRTRNALTVAAG